MSAIFSDETAVEHVQRVKPRPSRTNILELLNEQETDPETGGYRKKSRFELLRDVCGSSPIWLWPFPCLRPRRARNFDWSIDALGFCGSDSTVVGGLTTVVHSSSNGNLDVAANVPLLSAIHDEIQDTDTVVTANLAKVNDTRGLSAISEL